MEDKPIKNCPFCNEKAIIHLRGGHISENGWQVFCMNPYCDVRPSTRPIDRENDAIDA